MICRSRRLRVSCAGGEARRAGMAPNYWRMQGRARYVPAVAAPRALLLAVAPALELRHARLEPRDAILRGIRRDERDRLHRRRRGPHDRAAADGAATRRAATRGAASRAQPHERAPDGP